MTKRKEKVDATPLYSNQGAADAAFQRLNEALVGIFNLENAAAAKKKEIDTKLAEDTKDLYAEKKQLEKNVEAWAQKAYESGEFGGKRSLELPNAYVGFRKSTKTKWIGKAADVVAAIKRLAKKKSKLGMAVAAQEESLIKRAETPQKAPIRNLQIDGKPITEEQLAELGVKLDVGEVFAYNTDKAKGFDLSAVDDAAGF